MGRGPTTEAFQRNRQWCALPHSELLLDLCRAERLDRRKPVVLSDTLTPLPLLDLLTRSSQLTGKTRRAPPRKSAMPNIDSRHATEAGRVRVSEQGWRVRGYSDRWSVPNLGPVLPGSYNSPLQGDGRFSAMEGGVTRRRRRHRIGAKPRTARCRARITRPSSQDPSHSDPWRAELHDAASARAFAHGPDRTLTGSYNSPLQGDGRFALLPIRHLRRKVGRSVPDVHGAGAGPLSRSPISAPF